MTRPTNTFHGALWPLPPPPLLLTEAFTLLLGGPTEFAGTKALHAEGAGVSQQPPGPLPPPSPYGIGACRSRLMPPGCWWPPQQPGPQFSLQPPGPLPSQGGQQPPQLHLSLLPLSHKLQPPVPPTPGPHPSSGLPHTPLLLSTAAEKAISTTCNPASEVSQNTLPSRINNCFPRSVFSTQSP